MARLIDQLLGTYFFTHGKIKRINITFLEKCTLSIFFFFSSTTYITSCGNWLMNAPQ